VPPTQRDSSISGVTACRIPRFGGSPKESIPPALLRQREVAETDARKPPAGRLAGVSLGDNMLQLGPGPGLTTFALARTAPRVTAVEIDPQQHKWRERTHSCGNAWVVEGGWTSPKTERHAV
jgi:hypothetical protein